MAKDPEITDVLAIPLYPHYAMSSFETAVEHAKEIYKENNGVSVQAEIFKAFLQRTELYQRTGGKIRLFKSATRDRVYSALQEPGKTYPQE